MTNVTPQNPLRRLPAIEEVLQHQAMLSLEESLPHHVLVDAARHAVESCRRDILAGTRDEADLAAIAMDARNEALGLLSPSLRPVINATGIIVHTNLGRSILAQPAVDAVQAVAGNYSTLEYNPRQLARGSRHDHLESLLCLLTGAEAALAVNNNAAAVLLVLTEFAAGHQAVVSRGELVEIGGSFRIPDIMQLSHATMVEVGTTNKTHVSDYENVISDDTAMLLKVHPSNYRMIGFTESASIPDLRRLADQENVRRAARSEHHGHDDDLLVYEDQGSGAFLRLDCFGSYAEPTVSESVKAGCDLVSFSGDKLLGGAQAGFIVGRASLVARLKKNPLVRALRLDKMTIAALEATLRLYLSPEQALRQIPTLSMLTEPSESVQQRARKLATCINEALRAQGVDEAITMEVVPEVAHSGGGALPGCDIDSYVVRVGFHRGNAQDCEYALANRQGTPVIGRIHKEALLLDARTLRDRELPEVSRAMVEYLSSLAR